MSRSRVAAFAVLVVLTHASLARAQSACTITGQNLFVRDVLGDFYLWYRELPLLDPVRFDSPEAYLDAVRYRPIDESFSYITSRAATEAFYSDSQYIGLGFSSSLSATGMRILQVFDDSPASDTGLARGARVVEIGGTPVASLLESGGVDAALGPAEDGLEVSMVFERRDGTRQSVSMRKRPVTIPTVSLTRVFDVGGRKVGYLFFRNFVRPSVAALDNAFASLRDAGVTELVLDLRYNGGGLVDVATHLASLIGGTRTQDQVFAEYRHNDRNRRRDETLRFSVPEQTLGLTRVVVVATPATASASELVINGLEPFVDVVVVGDHTYGKPVGQYQFPFCDKVLAPVSFTMVNANGRGDYFGGLAADCLAGDDLEHELGDAAEASLAEALRVIATGACSAPPPAAASRRMKSAAPRAVGWASLVNAY